MPSHMNSAVLLGEISNKPVKRTLRSGDVLISFDLRVPGEGDGPRQSVPVTWIGPSEKQPNLEVGRDTLVVGRVHRRFYKGGGQLASRVDVRAESIIVATPARTAKQLEAAARKLTSP